MKLPNGQYRTEAGSTVTVTSNGGRSLVEFDWVEEDACYDCQVDPYPDGDLLTWHCDECGGGQAQIKPVDDAEDSDKL